MVEQNVASDTGAPLSVSALVREICEALQGAGVEQAAVEARDIVATVAGQGRFWPVLHGSSQVSANVRENARSAAARRAQGAPFAYAVGRAAFRHLTLFVDERVLIPRQETEQLVELVLSRLRARPAGVIADVGTGSGAIALSLATELKSPFGFIATDISRGAIEVAESNARIVFDAKSCPVEFRCGDMFSVIRETGLCAVVSNPPYIAFEEARSLPSNVRDWEPPAALYSDRQGMRAVERLTRGSARALESGGLLALEVDSNRASIAAELVLTNGSFRDVSVELDLTGRERFVLATKI